MYSLYRTVAAYIKNAFHRSETVIIATFLSGLVLYVVGYGIWVTHGFAGTPLNFTLAIILIPLLVVDVLKTAVETFFRKAFHSGVEEIDKISVIIPTHNGADTLPQTLEHLLRRFAPHRIIVSSNGSTDATVAIATQHGVRIFETDQPIGKVGAINVALDMVQTEYSLILDDDVLIGDAVFPTNPVGDSYNGVAFRVLPVVTNWLTQIQSHEYRKSMDIGKTFHNASATVANVSGAIGLFKTAELKRQVSLHTGEFCGEDLQRTLLVHLADQSKGVVIVDSVVLTQVPQTIGELFKQRVTGWSPGLYSNLGNYVRILFARRTPFALRYDAFYNAVLVALMDPLRLVALPILFFYPTLALLFYGIYVALETVPYLALARQEPYWVVLVYPFYGLFGLVSRLTAFGVFAYRKLANVFARVQHPDSYKHARIRHRFGSLIASQVVVLLIAFATLLAMNPLFAHRIMDKSVDTVRLGAHQVANTVL